MVEFGGYGDAGLVTVSRPNWLAEHLEKVVHFF
jgi:hypothetical protein